MSDHIVLLDWLLEGVSGLKLMLEKQIHQLDSFLYQQNIVLVSCVSKQ